MQWSTEEHRPHIQRVGRVWRCMGLGYQGLGLSPNLAYWAWKAGISRPSFPNAPPAWIGQPYPPLDYFNSHWMEVRA